MTRLSLLLAAALIAVVALAGGASAHVRGWCGHGEHYSGHSSYLVQFVREFDSRYRGHVHVVKISTGRTWYGSYPILVGYSAVQC